MCFSDPIILEYEGNKDKMYCVLTENEWAEYRVLTFIPQEHEITLNLCSYLLVLENINYMVWDHYDVEKSHEMYKYSRSK